MKREDMLIPRLRAYFQRNPHEYLTTEDMEVKFGASAERIRLACRYLRKIGVIKTSTVVMANTQGDRG